MLDHLFDGLNLRAMHMVAGVAGALLAVYAMQMWSRGWIGGIETCLTIEGLRRVALGLVGLSCLWSVMYAYHRPAWQPWPPDLVLMVAVDVFLLVTIIGGYLRKHRAAVAASAAG